uniref:Uncharacterized protein n=1 Tax=Cyprinodon variegatus TaxID=28743 RepID=A0A3Q2CGS1_CYPVA
MLYVVIFKGTCSLSSENFTLSRLTSMCCKVKMTGSLIKTRLDSLLIEAAMMSELTATVTLRP